MLVLTDQDFDQLQKSICIFLKAVFHWIDFSESRWVAIDWSVQPDALGVDTMRFGLHLQFVSGG